MNKSATLLLCPFLTLIPLMTAGCHDETPAPKIAAPVAVVTPVKPLMAAPIWDAPVDGRPVFMKVRAEGVQIYECVKTDAGFAWKLKAPEALLYDEKGKAIGKHGAGPSWELSDGSKVTGMKVGEQPHEGTIPWLLIKTTGTTGEGKLKMVKFIKRTDTDGGLPPTMVADAAHLGKEERVSYRATYAFYAGS